MGDQHIASFLQNENNADISSQARFQSINMMADRAYCRLSDLYKRHNLTSTEVCPEATVLFLNDEAQTHCPSCTKITWDGSETLFCFINVCQKATRALQQNTDKTVYVRMSSYNEKE